MGKIKRLEEDVARKIAAGEVVERPLSVVKELVENSIDAGADDIRVEIKDAGKNLIRVSDNGDGFEADDIETAFERHSTSKISRLDDFNSLITLGFRGEALPSILEVSKINLKTSSNTAGNGISCRFENNRQCGKEAIAFNKGTAIEVQDIFYNFPVRRKFLKSERAELDQIISFLEQIALVNYAIGFSLTNNDKPVFIYKKTAALQERIYQVFGKDFLDSLQSVDFTFDRYKLTGFISKINTGVSVKKHQYFFVNKRPIREKTLVAALNNTYQVFLEKSRSPIAILALEIPPAEIDVNIHPMKLEIKFENSSVVYRFIKMAIESALRGPSGAAIIDMRLPHFAKKTGDLNEPLPEPFPAPITRPSEGDLIQARLFAEGLGHIEEGFYLIGQYLNSYILVEKEGALLVVDQHNAAERINFDRLKKEYTESKVASIAPLFPIIIELTPSEKRLLDEQKMEILQKVGFNLCPLSGNSFDVKAFPQVLEERNIKDAVLTLIHLQEGDFDFEDRVLAEIACKSAIKVNHRLYPDKMVAVVKELFQSTNPYFCPHQRPIIIEFTQEKIEKLLKRK